MSQIKPSQRQKQTLEPQASLQADVYTRVIRRIIEILEQGVRPWMKPWSAQPAGQTITRPLRHNGTRYRGRNVMLLWCEAIDRGFSASMWMTYKQAKALGAQVRKG